MRFGLFVLIILQCFSLNTANSLKTAEAFKNEEIDKDMIKVVPEEQLQISYGNKTVQLGNQFKLSEVKDAPKVEWSGKDDSLYTLIKGWF